MTFFVEQYSHLTLMTTGFQQKFLLAAH